jgi:hypothetical protein
MSITTYSELKSAIADWTNKTNLTARLGDFVTLAEAKINRRLRVNEMEAALAETAIASGAVSRPAGMLAIKSIWTTGSDQRSLKQTNLEFINSQPTNASIPQWFAWSGEDLVFYPSGGSVAAIYYTAVPALSDAAPSNWLLAASPDLYLWASLEQACIFLKNPDGMATYGQKADGLIEELNSRSIGNQLSGGPLVARAR